ncbi:hypothetical protein lerEdw1_011628 [Lerista edwardsae]|nr:hypothetical protein lerEdw1_011628 [Lerista edwardsae]
MAIFLETPPWTIFPMEIVGAGDGGEWRNVAYKKKKKGAAVNGDSSRSPDVSVPLGAGALISCTHGVSSTNGVFWYQHSPGTAPHRILHTYSLGDATEGRFRMTVDKPNKSTELFISEVDLADAGVYYCAASDTVVGRRRRPEQKLTGRRDWRALG